MRRLYTVVLYSGISGNMQLIRIVASERVKLTTVVICPLMIFYTSGSQKLKTITKYNYYYYYMLFPERMQRQRHRCEEK